MTTVSCALVTAVLVTTLLAATLSDKENNDQTPLEKGNKDMSLEQGHWEIMVIGGERRSQGLSDVEVVALSKGDLRGNISCKDVSDVDLVNTTTTKAATRTSYATTHGRWRRSKRMSSGPRPAQSSCYPWRIHQRKSPQEHRAH